MCGRTKNCVQQRRRWQPRNIFSQKKKWDLLMWSCTVVATSRSCLDFAKWNPVVVVSVPRLYLATPLGVLFAKNLPWHSLIATLNSEISQFHFEYFNQTILRKSRYHRTWSHQEISLFFCEKTVRRCQSRRRRTLFLVRPHIRRRNFSLHSIKLT